MIYSVKSSRDNTKGHPPQLVSDPSDYKAVVGAPVQQVYFVLRDGVVDKRCYDNFEGADQRLRYFKHHHWSGKLTRDHEIAKSSLSNWKIISGYEKAINIWKEDQQERITQGHTRPRLSEFERGIKEWHKKNNPAPAAPSNKNLQRQPQPLVETVEQAINNQQQGLYGNLASPAVSPPKSSKLPAFKSLGGYKSLYIVECEQPEESDDCLIKIGVSTNPSERIRGLQIGSPFELQFVYKTKDSPLACSLEKWLHRKMEEMCVRGEWFKLNCLQLEKLKNFLADDRLFNTVTDNAQETWDSSWEEQRPFSDRNWMTPNKKEEADE